MIYTTKISDLVKFDDEMFSNFWNSRNDLWQFLHFIFSSCEPDESPMISLIHQPTQGDVCPPCLKFVKALDLLLWEHENLYFNAPAPVAQKVADDVVFRRFRGEGVEFFKIGPYWPPPQNLGHLSFLDLSPFLKFFFTFLNILPNCQVIYYRFKIYRY